MSDNLEELKKKAAEAEERAAKFERLHAESTIRRELLAAGEQAGAYSPVQLLPYLTPGARLIEANGQQVVRIAKTNEKGQETLHTPAEAVGHLKQVKDLENLFKKPVPVQPAAPTTPPKIDWAHMTHPEYLKLRDEHPEWIGLAPKRRK